MKKTAIHPIYMLNVYITYRAAQKSKPQISVHIFVDILWKICNKVVTKHTVTT